MKSLKMKAVGTGMDLPQEKLTELVGVTRQTIGMIKAGKHNPTLNLCVAVRRALRRALDELFWEEQQRIRKSERTGGEYGYDG